VGAIDRRAASGTPSRLLAVCFWTLSHPSELDLGLPVETQLLDK